MSETYQNPFIPNVHFELIPIKNLVSNQIYQRPISSIHVGRTAENFDVYQINPVKVSRRDGTNYVFDGQHTVEAVASASGSRDTPVWCMIYDDLNYEKEADIFANQKKYTRPLKALEIFNANIEAENNDQITIKRIVESYNLVISSRRIPGNVTAVGALEYIYGKYGFKVLDRTLFLAVSTWEGEVDSLSSYVLKGLAKLVVAYGNQLNDEQVVERLSKVSIREIIRNAKDRHEGTRGYAEAMLAHYNKRLKYPLRWKALQEAVPPNEESDGQLEMGPVAMSSWNVDAETGEVLDSDDYDDQNDPAEDPEELEDADYEDIIPDVPDALSAPALMDEAYLPANLA